MINLPEAIVSNPGYFKQLALKDGLLVNYQCPQMKLWEDTSSHLNHIIYTLSGKKILNTANHSYTTTEGSLFFLKPGAIRQGRFFDSQWQVIVFCLPDKYLLKIISEYRANGTFPPVSTQQSDAVFTLKSTEAIHSYFYSLLPYFTQSLTPPESLLELKCRELVLNILSQSENSCLFNYLLNLCDGCKPILSDVMEANYRYNLSLDEYARISGRSLTAFKNEFISTFHMPPGKWLMQRRLQHASLLLSASKKNINEIVYESGFESPTHFSRVFKEKFGLSPLQYRKQLINPGKEAINL